MTEKAERGWHLKMLLFYGVCLAGTLTFGTSSFPGKIVDDIPHFCLVKKLTDSDCPACGVTRSVASAFTLDFNNSVYYHPFGPVLSIILTGLVLYFGASTVARRTLFGNISSIVKAHRMIGVFTLYSLILIWTFNKIIE